MYAAERRAEITRLVEERGRLEVHELAEHLGVTPETVRKDLTSLESHGLVKRTHGGVIRVDRLSYYTPVTERRTLRHAEKEAIALEALRLVKPEATIGIDAGTTTIEIAHALPRDARLTVVTYSIMVATVLADFPSVRVLLLGGTLQQNSRAAVGSWAEDQLRQVTLDLALLSVDGVNLNHGLSTHNLAEARIKALMIDAARHVAVLADSSKLGKEEFARVDDLSHVNTIITDEGADPHWVDDLNDVGVKLVRASLRT